MNDWIEGVAKIYHEIFSYFSERFKKPKLLILDLMGVASRSISMENNLVLNLPSSLKN